MTTYSASAQSNTSLKLYRTSRLSEPAQGTPAASTAQISIARRAAILVLTALPLGRLCAANSAPQFDPVSDIYLSEGQSVTVTVQARDADGDPLTIGMTRRPSGSTFADLGSGAGSFGWQADFVGPLSSSSAPFGIEFVASDGTTQSTLPLTVFVRNVNRAPVINVPDTVTAEAGDVITFEPSVFEPDFERVTWRAPVTPPGSSFEVLPGAGSPARFRWPTSVADSGFASLTLIATDELGLADTTTTTILARPGAAHTLTIATDTIFPGEFLTLGVSLKNRDSLGAFDISINLDPSVMAILSVLNGSSRSAGFERFSFAFGNPGPGDVRVTGRADVGGGSPALPAGDGELFVLNMQVSAQSGLAGLFLPVVFGTSAPFDTFAVTLSGADGVPVDSASIALVDGGAKIKDQSALAIGDINLNGITFEIADALRFTNYFIDPVNFSFNAEQFANSDINGDGILASVADLVALIEVITSGGPGFSPRPARANQPTALFSASARESLTAVSVYSEPDIGGALMTLTAAPGNFRELSVTPAPELAHNGMTLKSHQSGDTLRVLVYGHDGGFIPGGDAPLFSIAGGKGTVALLSVESATASGAPARARIADGNAVALPVAFTLEQNYPNPFNPSTRIVFELDSPAEVDLVIYDILGRAVRTFAEGAFSAGKSELVWDGRDNTGTPVASGVYVYRLTVGDRAVSRKMTLVK
ncbi:MAG: FlgD immunoglobulin-like domain containing protein [Candidatus Zixiibacteriota bacterium]